MSSSTVPAIPTSRRKPLATCVAAIFALSASASIYATTFSVSNCADSGFGSLRSAAGEAVNSGDIIDITGITDTTGCAQNVDGFTNTILLKSTVTVSTGVTINGPPLPALAVSGQKKYRVFHSSGDLTINNLGIIYGGTSTVYSQYFVLGGCVLTDMGDLSMNGVRLDHCYAYTAAANAIALGGAVAAPIVTLTNSSITHSAAIATDGSAGGGAVYARASVTLNNTSISYATANASSYLAMGGAIQCGRDTDSGYCDVMLSNSDVTHASANTTGTGRALGGAVYAYGDVTLTNNSFIGNTAAQATSGDARGGAIMASYDNSRYGHVTLSYSQIAFAYANAMSAGQAAGGGIYASNSVALEDNSGVEYTHAIEYGTSGGSAKGGGIFGYSGVTISDSTIRMTEASSASTANTATALGGSVYSRSAVTLDHSVVKQGKTSATGSYSRGGGIYSLGLTTANYSLCVWQFGHRRRQQPRRRNPRWKPDPELQRAARQQCHEHFGRRRRGRRACNGWKYLLARNIRLRQLRSDGFQCSSSDYRRRHHRHHYQQHNLGQ